MIHNHIHNTMLYVHVLPAGSIICGAYVVHRIANIVFGTLSNLLNLRSISVAVGALSLRQLSPTFLMHFPELY